MNEITIKYSESPILIKHVIPIKISLQIMDNICLKIRDLDRGKKLK